VEDDTPYALLPALKSLVSRIRPRTIRAETSALTFKAGY